MKHNLIFYLLCIVYAISFGSCDNTGDNLNPIRAYTVGEDPQEIENLKLNVLDIGEKKEHLLIVAQDTYTVESSNQEVVDESSFEIKKSNEKDTLSFAANALGTTILTIKNNIGASKQILVEVEPLKKEYVMSRGTIYFDNTAELPIKIVEQMEEDMVLRYDDIITFTYNAKANGDVIASSADGKIQRYKGTFEIVNNIDEGRKTQFLLMTYNGETHKHKVFEGFIGAEYEYPHSFNLSEDWTARYDQLFPNSPLTSIRSVLYWIYRDK